MKMRYLRFLALLILITPGCSQREDSGQVAQSEASVDAGLKAFEERRWEDAEQQLSAAIRNGGLLPDLAEVAMRSLAISRVHLGKLTEAEADLQQLEQGAAEMDQLWLAKAELALKKGDNAATKAAIAEARKINRNLNLSEDLQKVR